VPAVVAAVAPCAQAQLIDEIDFRRDGARAVLQLRFVTPVQFRRAAAARSGDLTQVFYDVVAVREVPSLVPSERLVTGHGEMPDITVTDEATGRDGASRRLTLRLSRPAVFQVRAGRGDRTIEVVLEGLGHAIPAPSTPVAQQPPAEPGRFQITLLQSDSPELQLDTPIPAALDRYQVFTARRDVAGRTIHEVAIGYFETLVEAEAARRTLLRRFPRAAIVALQPPAPRPPADAAAATPGLVARPPAPVPGEVEPQAAALLAEAREAAGRQDWAAALERLNRLLNLPPNAATREGQELAGQVRLAAGDTERARAEFETFLKLYPTGADADRVRDQLARLPQVAEARPRRRAQVEPTTTVSGSLSTFYFGGVSKIRTQEFLDSPISGLPELASASTLSGVDQSQMLANVDLNWRHRDADRDMRVVFRDSYTTDLLDGDRNRNRLSAAYVEHRSLTLGTHVKLGRQSPIGGGVLGRFDGVQAGYAFRPKWRLNAVLGAPADKLLGSNRHFYGASIDADALTPQFGGSLYAIQQMIDGEIDRRGLGAEMRYFNGGVSATGLLDYDQVLEGLNIASLQGTWLLPDTTVVNFLVDRRSTPVLMLGNALFFGVPIPAPTATDPLGTRLATSLADLFGNGYTLAGLRNSVKLNTSYTTQGLLGVTTPIAANWQAGADLRITNLAAIPPIPVILPLGQGKSDNQSVGLQLIGTNLYSSRDTHVFNASLLHGSSQLVAPAGGSIGYRGVLLSYNNSSQISEALLLEPSLRLYVQTDSNDARTTRWMPGLRVTWRVHKQISIESELAAELGKVTSPTLADDSTRVFYYVGGRYDFY
jgi:hypothetical protein